MTNPFSNVVISTSNPNQVIVQSPGPQGAAGVQGAAGTSVTILGSYPSLAALQAAHPTGNIGDAYLVQGDLYVWNGTSWEDVGTIQGPQGTQGTSGPQGLTGIQGFGFAQAQGTTGLQGTTGAQGIGISWCSRYYWI
jgi:hypothetical protein